jgi:hypothetical protein
MKKLPQYDKCTVCKRPLKTAESRALGMGSVCAKRMDVPDITEGVDQQSMFKEGDDE